MAIEIIKPFNSISVIVYVAENLQITREVDP